MVGIEWVVGQQDKAGRQSEEANTHTTSKRMCAAHMRPNTALRYAPLHSAGTDTDKLNSAGPSPSAH